MPDLVHNSLAIAACMTMAVTFTFTWAGQSICGLSGHEAFDLGFCIDTLHCGVEKLASIIRSLLLILILALLSVDRGLENSGEILLI